MNIVYGKLSNDRIIWWQLLLEEFGPKYVHISGKESVVADALSRMEAKFNTEADDPSDKPEDTEACACMCAFTMSEMFRDEGIIEDDSEVIEYMCTSKNDTVTERLPMAPALIAREQKRDKGTH